MSDIAEIIAQRSARWMQAWVDRDRDILEDSLAPDFTLIVSATPNGMFARDRWLETCEVYRASSFRYRDIQVRELAPALAVMSSIADQRAMMGDVDRSGSFFLTDVWRLEDDGEWRVCARYSAYPEAYGSSSEALEQLRAQD